jgi:hypothetical protein
VALNTSKSGFQQLLSALLSVANQDQNMFLPPWVFSAMVNTVTSFLIDKCVDIFPSNPQVIDILYPFIRLCPIAPSGGTIVLPPDYRNILGAPSIIVKDDKSGECGEAVTIKTPQQFLAANLKGGCIRRPITIVPQSEFDYLTTSTYKKPDVWNPAGYNAGINENGQKLIRICPTDLSKVYLLYVKQENIYNLGYEMMPDETFIIDANSTIDTEWDNPATSSLMKGLTALYGAYSRDREFSNFANILRESNLL